MSEKQETLQLAVEGRIYQTSYTKKYRQRKKWEAPNPNHIISQIPGTVLSIASKEGSKVRQGETLLKYEAMKMHNTIVAPFDGTIKKVHVEEGQIFKKNTLLIELE